jgi:hypothetical protein
VKLSAIYQSAVLSLILCLPLGCGMGQITGGGLGLLAPDGGSRSGLESFSSSVYPFVRANCVSCHRHDDANAPATSFAAVNVENAYQAAKNYVDMADSSRSRLIERAQNGHCGISSCQGHGAEMAALVRTWVDVERAIHGSTPTSFVSASVAVPVLPLGAPPQRMRFALGSFTPSPPTQLSRSSFEIEIEHPTVDSYRVTRPRVVAPDAPIHIQGLRVLINGDFLPYSSDYVDLDRTIQSHAIALPENPSLGFPVLSSRALNLLKDPTRQDYRISISLEQVNVATSISCRRRDEFDNAFFNASTRIYVDNCSKCHSALPAQDGSEISQLMTFAYQRLRFDGQQRDQSCAALLQWVDRKVPLTSPLITYPYNGIYRHNDQGYGDPGAVFGQGRYFQNGSLGGANVVLQDPAPILRWINSEIAAGN